MNWILATCLLAVAARAAADVGDGQICPSRCRSDWRLAQQDCDSSDDQIYALCRVQRCNGGHSCVLPPNSILVPYDRLAQLEMVVEYAWSPEQKDLDTSTSLGVGEPSVGFDCNDTAPYVRFDGDDTDFGGAEVAVVDIYGANGGYFDDNAVVQARAAWNGDRNLGAARVTVYLREKNGGAVEKGSILATTVYPGVGTTCAATTVATVEYFHGDSHSRFTLRRA
ncbi:unnamed protein product [Agarophyton chilense]